MKAAITVSGLGAVITCGTLGTYSLSRVSVQEKINDDCMEASAELEGWKIAETKLERETEQTSLMSPFKELYEKIKGNGNPTGSSLREVCLEIYSWDSSNIFKSENKKFTEQVKKYCGLKIKERLGEGNLFGKTEEEVEIQKKIELLNSHDDSYGVLSEKLKALKEAQKDDKKEDFKKACEDLYDRPFLTEESNDWTLIKNYCHKGSGPNKSPEDSNSEEKN